ncbi:2-dehydropantoate 2-reductase [Achromobacter xylosoxidans]|uniref:ketopantoate reductase family protein n=1 Tax=Alcaligenes xylosoxydans xylosoxydans TaxID=85698 RepID=UPI0006C0908E|nr:2-dehydropantoate 2-reductase [Achromobacter xylosoxidans]MDX3880725.1 2-dehydropantoate 2-reductase [Achromobacter sp.]CUJ39017.1 2-dehydropantoate 2-reductase [Achromobacter xylosoxidans]CUJ50417.1 2-dehydropantoate 2-reductase [Achromobacter xylosoxidans]
MHIAIFGAGSVGGYVGAMLTAAGGDITLVDAWPQHVEAMQRDGLHLSGTQGDRTVAVEALGIADVQKLARKPIDVALLCVKSYDTAWMTALIKDYLSPSGYIVSMQNGMNEDVIAGIVGWGRVVGCVLNTIGVEMTGPGAVMRWMEPAAPGYSVFRIGEIHGRATQRAQALAQVLQAVDNASVTSNLWGERWSKLANNAMASAIGPIANVGIREMYADRDLRRLSIRSVVETIRVGQGMGLELEKICGMPSQVWLAVDSDGRTDYAPIESGIAEFEKRIGAAGQPSTLHDVRRGRRTEIDSINGLVASKAAEAGIPAPLHTELTALVQKVAAGRLAQGKAALQHLFDHH